MTDFRKDAEELVGKIPCQGDVCFMAQVAATHLIQAALQSARDQALEEARVWLPISTAPKDGTRILVHCFAHGQLLPRVVHWSDLTGVVENYKPKWVEDDGTEFPNAEYWFPLPAIRALKGKQP